MAWKKKKNEQTNKQTEKLNRTVKVLNLLIPFPIFDDKEVRPVIIYQQVSATLVQLTRSGYHYVIFSLSWKWDVTCNELRMVKMYWNTSPASVTLRIPNTQVSPRRGNKTTHALTPCRTFSSSDRGFPAPHLNDFVNHSAKEDCIYLFDEKRKEEN